MNALFNHYEAELFDSLLPAQHSARDWLLTDLKWNTQEDVVYSCLRET